MSTNLGAVPTNKSDTLIGTGGDDIISGGNGDDIIYGAGGNDVLCGGNGKDTLFGGAGSDNLFGGNGKDSLDGGAGYDQLSGGNGKDDCVNGEANGDDCETGEPGQDPLPGVVTEQTETWQRTYHSDGLLGTVTHTQPDGQTQTWNLTCDRSTTVPQLLGWTGTEIVDLIRGLSLDLVATGDGLSPTEMGPLGDLIGSTVAVSGTFSPYGAPEVDGFGLGYRGELHIGPTLYLRNRDHSPELRRFLTVDPLPTLPGQVSTSNYAYAANNPIGLIDPLGLRPTDLAVRDGRGSTTDTGRIQPRPGYGQVEINLFIPNEEICYLVCILGDGRGFDDNAGLAQSRAVLDIDFETGRVRLTYNESCRNGQLVFGVGRDYCQEAYPTTIEVRQYSECSEVSSSRRRWGTRSRVVDDCEKRNLPVAKAPGKNGATFFDGRDDLVIGIEGEISVGPWGAPSINGLVTFQFGADGSLQATQSGNTFPSYEIYQDLNGSRTPVERISATGHGALFDGAAGPVFKAADGVSDAVVDTGRAAGRAAGVLWGLVS